MNDSKKMAIIIAVVFFLAGTVLNIDYAMWNEKIYTEYQESTPYICWSLHDDINKCPEEMRTHIEYNDWKFYNGKSYWKDLAGRLSVMEVSAYGEPAEYNYTLQVEDNIEWSTYTPSNATYTDVIPQPIYYVRHRGPSLDLPEGAEVTINVTFYEEGYNATPPEEEYKWSDDDLNISQWDDEYPPKEPKLTELDGEWTEVDESIFKMYPIHNPPTIYVMQVASGWDYHTFKLPIYRRI